MRVSMPNGLTRRRASRAGVALAVVLSISWVGCNLILGNNAATLGSIDGSSGGGGPDGTTGGDGSSPCCDGTSGGDGGPLSDSGNGPDGCGTSCQPPPCEGGGCNPTPLATAQALPLEIVVDNTTVFWTNNGGDAGTGSVASIPIAGGTVQTLAPNLKGPLDIALDSTNVYWVSHDDTVCCSNGDIATVAKGGGSPAFIQGQQDKPYNLAVYGGNYFWALEFFGDIEEKIATQVNPVQLGSNFFGIDGIAVDSTGIYATVSGDNSYPGIIQQIDFDAGGSVLYNYSNSGLKLHGIAIDATNVYFSNASDSTVLKLAKKANSQPTVLANAQNNPMRVAVDGTFVYWTTEGTAAASYMDGTVMKVPIAGGTAIPLANGQNHPHGLAVDGANVYWTNVGDGTVMKRPKS